MRYADFGGRAASVIALGTMDFGGRIEEGLARDMMDAYVGLGGNFIDTARVYGDFARGIQGGSEQVIGRWLEDSRRRNSILLGTKGGHPPMDNMHAPRLSRREIRDDIQRSLDNLRCNHVDIYFLHRDDPARDVADILETLTGLTEDGLTAMVGVSNWRPARLRAALDCARERGLVRICADQPQFSLARQVVVEDDTLYQLDAEGYALHLEEKLPCVAFSSQAKGFLTKMAAVGADALKPKARRRFLCEENLGVLDRTTALSHKTGLSVNAIALSYLTSQPFPVFPIAGASTLEQIEALAEAGDAQLTPEQCDFLRKF